MPCRPNGRDNPQECCRFDVTNDPEENSPYEIGEDECKAIATESKALYLGREVKPSGELGDLIDPPTAISKSCEVVGDNDVHPFEDRTLFKYPTIGCDTNTETGEGGEGGFIRGIKLFDKFEQSKYSLWTHCECPSTPSH